MSPTSKDPATGWKSPHRGLIQYGYPLNTPLSLGNRLPNWREVPIYFHPVCKAEVQEVQYHDLPHWGERGRSRHCRADTSCYHTFQSRCKSVESGI